MVYILPMIPLKILLTYYQTTRARLGKASLPYGVSMTKFVNDAICEKLDREQPETIGAMPVQPVESVKPVKPVEIVKPVKRMEIVKPVQPMETVKPVQPVEIVKPVKPVEIVEDDEFWGNAERMRELVKRHAR
jgi:hypothetical protein